MVLLRRYHMGKYEIGEMIIMLGKALWEQIHGVHIVFKIK